MPRPPFHRFALPIAAAGRLAAAALSAALMFAFSMAVLPAGAEATCTEWHAELTAVEGSVEIRRAGETQWRAAASGASLCYGDSVSVKTSSRAALTLPDHSTLRLDANTTLTLTEPEQRGGSLVELLNGVIHVISRDPRFLKFTTPFANAGLEGTEFDIRVSDREAQTEVVVLEGKVAVTTPNGDLGVPSGQIAIARAGQPPSVEPVAEAIDLMRWTGHFPRIVDGAIPTPDERAPPTADAEFFARRAASRLERARIDGANADVEAALQLEPKQPIALAMKALMALARADHESALRIATAATTNATASAPAWLALSYVKESEADLRGATASAARAVELEPNSALALSRSAALALANGDASVSIEIASHAADLAPERAEPLTVLGYAYLSRLNSAAARESFESAAALEPAAPLPRLGLGLALIQGGDLIAGRQQIELAVAFDPTNSLARSYMAKVYEAEDRAKLSGSQLELAKRFDPLDPTPWIYAALEKRRANRPVEAFTDLQAAQTKNRDRVALRSRLPMDADLSTRNSGIAGVSRQIGFDRLALRDAWQAVADNPSDYAGHRLLADAYSHGSREEIARVSEQFIAQLLQPANLAPIPAQLGQPTTSLARHLGPTPLDLDELQSPVTQNGLRLQTSGSIGGASTDGREIAVAGLHDQVSYSFGGYRFASDGFRANNDRDEHVANAFVQYRPALDTSLQMELRSTHTNHGDLASYFDPSLFVPAARLRDVSDSVRFSARHDLNTRDTLLASFIHANVESDVVDGDTFNLSDVGRSSGVDLQLMHDAGALKLRTGMSQADTTDAVESRLAFPGSEPTISTSADRWRQTDLYTYVTITPTDSVTVTAGATWNSIEGGLLSEQRLNPKLGVAWRPTSRTTLRAAAFRSLASSITTSRLNPQPRLEPAQIAGFSQSIFGGPADETTLKGIAADHTVSQRLFVGLETSHRDVMRTLTYSLPEQGLRIERVALSEHLQSAYLYWIPTDRLGLSATIEQGRYTNEIGMSGVPLFNFSDLDIERLPIELRYFSPTGLMLGFRTSHIKEHGSFVNSAAPGTLEPGSDRFWLVDAFIGYRLPNRRGLLSLNADNLLDRRFRFQDVDPEDPTLIPERLFSFRFTLAFD